MTPAVVPEVPVLTETIRTGLLDLFHGVMKEEQTARRSEVREAWQQRAFRNGIQHMWYDSSSYMYMTPEASGLELPQFRDVYNIYTPHWRSFVSLLSQNPVGVNFPPNDLQKAGDVTAAAYAEKMRHRVDRLVHMKDRQMEAAGFFCTDGRTVARTYIDKNGELRCDIRGVLETKVPIFARRMEKWSYCVISEEIDIYEAKEEHPDFADEIESEPGTSETTYEKYARLNIISNNRGYADSLKSIATQHIAWLRPSRYRKATEETEEFLGASFPDGVRLTIVGGALVDATPEVMEKALRVEWPSPGQGQSRPSILHDLVPLQRAFNDYKNNLREQAGYINPATWVDGDAVDPEAIPEQRSEPGAIHVITPKAGRTVSDSVFQESSNGMSPELAAACDSLQQLAEFTTGDLPSLYGGDTEGQDTVGVNKLLNNQAKGQLSMAWAGMQWLFAGIYEVAVRLAAEMSEGPTAIEGGNGQESFNPAAILDGNWGCYPDTDSSFPETMADKRAALQMVLQQLGAADPAIPLHPDNLKLVKQYTGLSDLIIPAAEARDKQLDEIEQLLKESPVPDESKMPQYIQMAQQAVMNGQAPPEPPLTASIGIKPRDFHEFEVAKCNEWLSSQACREELRRGNQLGVQNVELHADLHDAAIAKKAAANAQQQPMSISGSFKDLDPATKVQVLERDGYKPDATAFEADAVQVQQDKAATTQHKAAQAQHQSVLAAKEAVAPVKTIPSPQPPKDSPNGR